MLEYDDVINKQREVIYNERHKVLFGQDLKETVEAMIDEVVDQVVDGFAGEIKFSDDWDLPGLINYIDRNILPGANLTVDDLVGMTKRQVKVC